MATVILVRHGRTTANATGILAGRTPGVALDDRGIEQARATAERIRSLPLAAIVSSPLQRCRQTAKLLAEGRESAPAVRPEPGLIECDYGDWQGQALKDLAKEKLWSTVQRQASAATFPDGESMRAMQARAVDAVRRHDGEVERDHGAGALWVAVSHGDLIKSILADALGMHLDLFQRIAVDPASISLVRYDATRPTVLAVNTHAGDLGWLAPPKRSGSRRRPRAASAETVGGGAGPALP